MSSHTVRSRRRTPIRVIAKGMDMHPALRVRILSADIPRYRCRAALILLLKCDAALDGRVASHNGH